MLDSIFDSSSSRVYLIVSPSMTGHHDSAPIKQANTAFPVVTSLVAFSSAWWAFYAVPLRRKEWLDIMLDYGHHKRTKYSSNLLDKGALFVLKALKMKA